MCAWYSHLQRQEDAYVSILMVSSPGSTSGSCCPLPHTDLHRDLAEMAELEKTLLGHVSHLMDLMQVRSSRL